MRWLFFICHDLSLVKQFQPINQFTKHISEFTVVLLFRKIKDSVLHHLLRKTMPMAPLKIHRIYVGENCRREDSSCKRTLKHLCNTFLT